MIIAVIDGQGGGIGKEIIRVLRSKLEKKIKILAIGTNSVATTNMLKAGADYGATGENPVIYNSTKVDLIVGPIAIIIANGLRGEVSPAMAEAIATSPVKKILLSSNKCNVEVVDSNYNSLSIQVETLVNRVQELIKVSNEGELK